MIEINHSNQESTNFYEALSMRISTIFALKVEHLLKKRYLPFLAYIIDKKQEEISLGEILVVQNFPEIFLEELLGLPLKREIEFLIEIEGNTTLISTAPYRMTPTKLKKLKVQLQELLDKGFIR